MFHDEKADKNRAVSEQRWRVAGDYSQLLRSEHLKTLSRRVNICGYVYDRNGQVKHANQVKIRLRLSSCIGEPEVYFSNMIAEYSYTPVNFHWFRSLIGKLIYFFRKSASGTFYITKQPQGRFEMVYGQ